ncbi:LysR family transcriptional regulator [Occultella aeris]|uniref:HTH-type transcriptional regulator BenM n=1 Tax=Occultella aeris TaxID=2761496 RepID=A0A7M4DR56_9MICO|nr:LysR family transcriptional regulator [Occultella aeris]VZO39950.1 HTH-type transcriptional regulator BenM [Occultella aeris]
MYTLDQLVGFVAVAEEGSFAGAADRLRMTQPPLSRQVRKLERDVGVELLVRHHRGARPTPAGRVFLDEARRLLARAESARLRARSAADGTTGTVRIAFTAVSAMTVLGPWASTLAAQLPDVDLILTEMVTGEQVEALLAGEIDVGLARDPARTEPLTARPVASESMVLAVPTGHPLTGLRPTLADVAAHPLVTYAPAQARYLYETVAGVFRDANLTPRYVQHVAQVNSVLALVGAGLGVALVPSSVVTLQLPSVTYLEVSDMPEHAVQVHCVWRSDNDNPALARALTFI